MIEVNGFNIEKLESFPPGENPFLYDFYHIGEQLGENVWVMFNNQLHEETPYVILVNQRTGERIKIVMSIEEEIL
jgi:hypothetical protein